MLSRIAGVMLDDKGRVMQQDEGGQISREPGARLVCVDHFLQSVQNVTSQIVLDLVDQDRVELCSHDRWDRDLSVRWAGLVEDVRRHIEGLLADKLK